MTLKSPVVIFQALEPLQSQWPQQPQQPQQPQWPQWPGQPHFIKKITDPDGWIIPVTKMTNKGLFLWNGSSKIHFFTNIWYIFFWRLLRPADATFLKIGWWNTNGQPSWPCSQRYIIKILNLSTPQSHLKKPYHYETSCIYVIQQISLRNRFALLRKSRQKKGKGMKLKLQHYSLHLGM